MPPPEVPFEGFLNISSPVHEVDTVDTCQVDGEDLEIACPSFLNIFIQSATYGRVAGGKTVCTGEKDRGPSSDCLDTGVLDKVRGFCHGSYNCSIGVSHNIAVADLSGTCNTNKKELNITHTCGKHNTIQDPLLSHCVLVACYPWDSYVTGVNCAGSALLQNGWVSPEQYEAMGESDIKSALIENLHKHLDREIHSLPELSYR